MACFALALALAPGGAFAGEPTDAPKTSSLSWTRLTGAEGCIGTHDLAVKIEAILGHHAIVSASESDRSIEGRIETKTPTGFRSTIVIASSKGDILGTREIPSDEADCRAMDDSIALTVALMIDPDALTRPKPDPDPKDKPDPNGDKPKVIVHEKTKTIYVPVPVEPPKETGFTYRIEGYLGGAFGIGVTPPAFGFISGLLFDPSFFGAFEATGSLTYAKPSIDDTKSATFWHFDGSLYFCPLADTVGVFQGAMCAGFQGGVVATSFEGVSSSDAKFHPVFNGALRGRAGFWFYPVSLAVGAALSLPFVHFKTTYMNQVGTDVTLHEVAPVAGMFDLTIGLEFPKRPAK